MLKFNNKIINTTTALCLFAGCSANDILFINVIIINTFISLAIPFIRLCREKAKLANGSAKIKGARMKEPLCTAYVC